MPVKSIFAAALALLGASSALAGPVPIGPAATAFKVGSIRVVALRDMINAVPNDASVFGPQVGVPAVSAVLRQAGAPTDTLPLGVDALLVELPGHTVLIDTGLGPKVGGALPRSFAAAGVDPAKVTDVLITHSHGDHVGGLLTADGGLAFPNATIRMAAAEWAFLKSKPDNAALAAAITPKVQTFTPGAAVVPGIRAIPLPGHTPGHSGYEIVSGKERLLDIGDSAHSAIVSLAKPEWVIAYDTDAKQGVIRREATLAQLAASHERVFSPHFPFPGVGQIVKRGTGYVWQPARR
ncbi:hydrolase [Sphingomonas glacialis]|uniref:Hydrolase n=1 Tax=Sphingomonas glacialis TaxID=658225 RepID=A0ABQ3LM68_9SPHN|nr:MBL fold metallo-hydrolase [Sphingomonas glacialis]GHH20287.1 hydrolase [Sphingomonas glacialis]